MSDKTATEPKSTKGRGLFIKLLLAAGLLTAGGGTAYGLIAAGIIPGLRGSAAAEDTRPKLVRRGETDPYAPPAPEGQSGEQPAHAVAGHGGSAYRVAYFTFADEFTSNLRDSDALIQLNLAASTRRDGRVLAWMKSHELAERSAILEVLADTPEEDVHTSPGKARLRRRLTDAINRVLTEREGFGGVDAVYFKTLLVQ